MSVSRPCERATGITVRCGPGNIPYRQFAQGATAALARYGPFFQVVATRLGHAPHRIFSRPEPCQIFIGIQRVEHLCPRLVAVLDLQRYLRCPICLPK